MTVTLNDAGRLSTICFDQQLDLFAHRHVHFCTNVSNCTNGIHEQVHLGNSLWILESRIIYRPCCQCNGLTFMWQMLPDLFGDVWHKRMNQAHRLIQHISQHGLCFLLGNRIFPIEGQFSKLNVPITQVIPDKVIQHTTCFPKFIRFD
ncbi:hypothetical protein D3C74_348590 [compost metagenome]